MPKAFMKLPLGVNYPDNAKVAECQGDTVAEALDDLLAREPRLRPRVYKEDGRLFVGIFLNGRNVKQLQGLETPISDGDELRLMPPIAGG